MTSGVVGRGECLFSDGESSVTCLAQVMSRVFYRSNGMQCGIQLGFLYLYLYFLLTVK